jgi:hypothetical protein
MAKANRDVNILINGRDNSRQAFASADKNAANLEKRIQGMGRTAFSSAVSITAITAVLARAAEGMEKAAREGKSLTDVLTGHERLWASIANDTARSVPIYGQLVKLGNMFSSNHRDALRIQHEMEQSQKRQAEMMERAARAAKVRVQITDQQIQAQRRLEAASAQTDGQRLDVAQRHQVEDVREQFRRMSEQARNQMSGGMLDSELQRIAQTEAQTLRAIEAEFAQQRQQLEAAAIERIDAQQQRMSDMQFSLNTGALRAEGREVEAMIQSIQRDAAEAASAVHREMMQESRHQVDEVRQLMQANADQETRLIHQVAQQRIAAIEAEQEQRRRAAQQAADDVLADARIQSLRTEVDLGNESLRVELQKAEIQRQFMQRQRQLQRALEDETLDAERRREIEEAIVAAREQERRALASAGADRGTDPMNFSSRLQAFESRTLTSAPGARRLDPAAATQRLTQTLVDTNEKQLKALEKVDKSLARIERTRIVVREAS